PPPSSTLGPGRGSSSPPRPRSGRFGTRRRGPGVIRFGSSVSPPASPPMSMPPALRWPIPAPDPAAPIFWTVLLSAQRRGPRWGGPGPRDDRSGSLAFLMYAEAACKTGGLPVLLSPVPQVAASTGLFLVFTAVLRYHGLFGGELLSSYDPTHA